MMWQSFIRSIYIGIAVFAFLLNVQPVYADPHAVFYTSIGQQQLFYNVLAALNQADFAEPATNTIGTSSGNSRQELLESRTTAASQPGDPNATQFQPENFPVLVETETELASVLSRSITLEGQDLWTAYLYKQSALENKRRDDFDTLLGILCNIGLSACGGDKGSTHITNGLRIFANQHFRGVWGALQSDTDPNSFFQQASRQEAEKAAAGEPVEPLAFSAPIATLRSNAGAGGGGARNAVERLITATGAGMGVSGLDTTVFNDLEINSETGEVNIREISSSDPAAQDLLGRDANLISSLSNLPFQVFQEAIAGANAIKAQQASKQEDGGSLADTVGIPTGQKGIATGIKEIIKVPAGNIRDTTAAAVTSLANAEQNIKDAPIDYTKERVESNSNCDGVEKDGVCLELSNPDICYTPGQSLSFSINVRNISGEDKFGVFRLYPLLGSQIISSEPYLIAPSYSPTPSNSFGSGKEWRGQTIGEQTYTISSDEVNPRIAPGDPIIYRATFKYGRRFNGVSAKVTIHDCGARIPESATVLGDTSPTNVGTDTVKASNALQPTVAAGTTSAPGTTDSQVRSPADNLLPVHEDSASSRKVLEFLSGGRIDLQSSAAQRTVSGAFSQVGIANYFSN